MVSSIVANRKQGPRRPFGYAPFDLQKGSFGELVGPSERFSNFSGLRGRL